MDVISFWDLVRVKLNLASPALQARYQDALWRGVRPSPAARAFQKMLGALLILLLALLGAYLCLPLALLGSLGTLSLGQGQGRRAGGGRQASAWTDPLPSGPGTGRTDKKLLELLTPEARQEVQRSHDSWQERYGDGTYRAELKPQALQLALQSYLDAVMQGGISESPSQWLSRMTPEQIRGFTARAESEARPARP